MILKKIRDCDGQSMVEFALVIPLVLLLLFGIIEFGRVYSAQLAVDNAARQGARLAAVGASVTDTKQAAIDSAFNISLTATQVTVTPSGGNVKVSISYPVQIVVPLISNIIGNTVNVKSEVIMRLE